MDENLNRRLAEVARIAVHLEAETGVPARLLIAQWAIESKWGAKPVGAANYFGMKRAARHAKYCTVTTREVIVDRDQNLRLEFADYDSLEDACRDYAWLISHGDPYRKAWAGYRLDADINTLAEGVGRVYATIPTCRTLKRIAHRRYCGGHSGRKGGRSPIHRQHRRPGDRRQRDVSLFRLPARATIISSPREKGKWQMHSMTKAARSFWKVRSTGSRIPSRCY